MTGPPDKPIPGYGNRQTHPNAYAALDRAHQKMTRHLAREKNAMQASPSLVDPTYGTAAIAPAIVVGNEWVSRHQAYAQQVHVKLHGAHPQPAPSGFAVGVSVPMARPAAVARPPEPALDPVEASRSDPPSQHQPETGTEAAQAAKPAMRVQTASLWEAEQSATIGVLEGVLPERGHSAAVDAVYRRAAAQAAEKAQEFEQAERPGRTPDIEPAVAPRTERSIARERGLKEKSDKTISKTVDEQSKSPDDHGFGFGTGGDV